MPAFTAGPNMGAARGSGPVVPSSSAAPVRRDGQAKPVGRNSFPAPRSTAPAPGAASKEGKPRDEGEILFQQYFKSVGPRTYAAQVKRAGNGNHFLVLTEGRRDDKTGEVRKARLFVFSEDFNQFLDLIRDTARFIKDHPVPEEVRRKREKFWAKQEPGTKPANPQPLNKQGG